MEIVADAELVARSRKRDADAFGALVERHQRLVFGVAFARCRDAALAEDVAQEAFVAAWRDLDRLRDSDRVGSWVAGIARNLASSAVRKQARQVVPEVLEDDVATPEDEALAREDRELLAKALEEVPEAHRETLVLYYLQGESIADIATGLGVTEDVVKQRLSRGRKALRDSVTTRVESALSRTRLRPAFRAGVMAVLTTAAARDASAAGKVLMAKKIAIGLVATAAVAGGAVWLGTRARASEPQQPAATTSTVASAASGPMHVARLDPAKRAALLELIRSAHEHRAAPPASAASTTSGTSAATAAPALPGVDLDKEYIQAAVREIAPLLRECYESGLSRDPSISGKIVVDFTIEGEPDVGGVIGDSAIDADKSSLTDPGVRECVKETMYALQIDPPPMGGVVRVAYPFVFASN